ncbi:Rac GTPase-activating protein 1 [Dermatophagoides farinae]|uniref:Rac GTPase-activating protein 1 n=1 Tax=Dermatophagoides farinae TaxID=6954 RepID=A0A922L9T9_DERFA|nr:Rac GTPase-activating protein 1 [Dermatophagoides farinae]
MLTTNPVANMYGTYQRRRCSFVPWLVGQFNDIIEWKTQVAQNDLEYQAQRANNSSNYQRRYSNTSESFAQSGLQRSATDSSINRCFQYQSSSDLNCHLNEKQQRPLSPSKKRRVIKLRLRKGQDDLNHKLSQLRHETIENRIDESNDENVDEVSSSNITIVEPVEITSAQIDSIETVLVEHMVSIAIDNKEEIKPYENNDQLITDIQEVERPISPKPTIDENNNAMLEMDKPSEPEKVKPSMNSYNVLLEKLASSYRHHFQMKTVFKQNAGIEKPMGKQTSISRHCFCGKEFNFSDKYLQCFNCLTGCHTNCGQIVPRPCIRYVDPFIRPSKTIANYIFPRSKPLIPALLVHLCGQIERECQKDDCSSGKLSSFELYYIHSEMLKPVKDQCKRLLQDAKHGFPRLDECNLDHLCGMVKYFLGEMIEPLFPKQLWKDYSPLIHKKSDQELREKLLESLKQFNAANLHSLCFILVHLKHLIRCGFQNGDILTDIFCPILMGELECKRKLRLMKLMFDLEEKILVSFAQL